MIYNADKRIIFVDVLKAITIFLVVLGHTPLLSSLAIQWIYAFHMPAFFAVYGMTYDIQSHSDRGWMNREFLLSKAKRLLVPCFVWGLIYAEFSVKNIAYMSWGSQAAFRAAGSLTSLWFLPCMFLSVCMFEIVMRFVSSLQNRNHRIAILIIITMACFAVGALLPRASRGYPWSVDVSFTALGFLITGYGFQTIIRSTPVLNEKRNSIWILILVIAFIISLSFLANLRFITIRNVDMASRNFGNLFLFVLTASAGIVMLTALSVILEGSRFSKFLSTLGKYSMPIFLLHKPMVLSASKYLSDYGANTWVAGVAIALVVTAICLVISLILENFAPNLIGQKR